MSNSGIQSLSEQLEATTEGMASFMLGVSLVTLIIALVVFCVASARGQRLGPSVKLLFCASVVALAPMALSVVGSIAPAYPSSLSSSHERAKTVPAVEIYQESPSSSQTWEAGGSID